MQHTADGVSLGPLWEAIGNVRGEMRAEVRAMRRELKEVRHGHSGRKIPWMQILAMGTVAFSSVAGILSPEKAAALLRALLH